MDRRTMAWAKKKTMWERMSVWIFRGMRFSDDNEAEKNLEMQWRLLRS